VTNTERLLLERERREVTNQAENTARSRTDAPFCGERDRRRFPDAAAAQLRRVLNDDLQARWRAVDLRYDRVRVSLDHHGTYIVATPSPEPPANKHTDRSHNEYRPGMLVNP
jgi:hypothetical protein